VSDANEIKHRQIGKATWILLAAIDMENNPPRQHRSCTFDRLGAPR
jgi:hypothetical protein